MEIITYFAAGTACLYCALFVVFCTANRRYLTASGAGVLVLLNILAALYALL